MKKKIISLLIVLSILFSFSISTSAATASSFKDIYSQSWYYDAVVYVTENGYMSGMSSTSFNPSGTVTRAQVAQILYAMEGKPSAGSSQFTDVADGKWYSNAITWAAEKGYVSGYGNGIFGPTDNITREQFVAILYKYAKDHDYNMSSLESLNSYADSDQISSYAVKPMRWAVHNGLISGTNEGLEPKSTLTRAQLAVIIKAFTKHETADLNYNSAVIVLDPGHSSVIPSGTEPLGPGSSTMKAKDAYGTSGVSTGVTEYQLTLTICNKLKTALEARGYTVIMTRYDNNTAISCKQRAEVANNNNADVFLRVHANGVSSSSKRGAMTICTTQSSPYVPQLYTRSKLLSQCVLDEYCSATGITKEYVWETDTMTGNNWSNVPTTLIELGYMTNPTEDKLMEDSAFQEKMVNGIVNGIEAYLAQI